MTGTATPQMPVSVMLGVQWLPDAVGKFWRNASHPASCAYIKRAATSRLANSANF